VRYAEEEKNHGNKKVQVMLDLDQVIHPYGMEEELLLDQGHAHTHIKLTLRKFN
jgi:hypothetical protein